MQDILDNIYSLMIFPTNMPNFCSFPPVSNIENCSVQMFIVKVWHEMPGTNGICVSGNKL